MFKDSNNKFKCPACPASFSYAKRLRNHWIAQHPANLIHERTRRQWNVVPRSRSGPTIVRQDNESDEDEEDVEMELSDLGETSSEDLDNAAAGDNAISATSLRDNNDSDNDGMEAWVPPMNQNRVVPIAEALHSCNLHYNAVLQVLICKGCGTSVSKHYMVRHLKTHHSEIPTKFRGAAGLQDVLEQLNVNDGATLVEGMELVPFLKVVTGQICSRCHFKTTSTRLMQEHLTDHDGDEASAEACQLQTLSSFHRSYVRVVEREATDDLDLSRNQISALASAVRLNQEEVSLANTNDLSAFLRITRWDERIESLNVADLLGLVSMPKIGNDDEMPQLREGCRLLIESLNATVVQSAQLLRDLAAPTRERQQQSFKFRSLQDSTTRNTYGDETACYLSFLIRACTSEANILGVLLTEAQQNSISELKEALGLCQTTAEGLGPLLIETLKQIFQDVDEFVDTELEQPIALYIMVRALRENKSFIPPMHLTTIIAKLQWVLRGTFLNEAARLEEISAKAQAMRDFEPVLSDNYWCPFQSLRILMRLSTTYANQHTFEPVVWEDNSGTSLLIWGKKLRVLDIQEGVKDLINSLETDLAGGLFRGELFKIPQLIDLQDNLAEFRTGYSFLYDDKNCLQSLVNAGPMKGVPRLFNRFHYARSA